jgi:uncharacterized protein YkwD
MKLLNLSPALCAIMLAEAVPLLKSVELAVRQDPNFQCEFRTFITVMLQSFNLHRANHSVDPFEWNQTLADAAQYTVENGAIGVHDK